MNAGVTLAMAGLVAGADPDGDRVLKALTDHFSRIHSIRVEAEVRGVESGGLLADDPTKSKPTYLQKGKASPVTDEYEVWLSPPKYRQFWTAVGRHSNRAYFDGRVFTHFNMDRKSGYAMEGGGNSVHPLRNNAIHAIGYCFPDTFNTSLSALVSDRDRVTVRSAGKEDGADVWLIEVRSLPAAVNPQGWSDKARQNAIVRIWLTVDPEVVIDRWAIYYPGDPHPKELTQALARYGRKPVNLPIFDWDGHFIRSAFLNCDHAPTEDNFRGRKVLMPKRVLQGNETGCEEAVLRRVVINPAETPDTFRPAPPAGFTFKPDGGATGRPQAADGSAGEVVRVGTISRQAREMLASADATRATEPAHWGWLVPTLGAASAVVAGVILVRLTRSQESKS